jgi:hypothetical protein
VPNHASHGACTVGQVLAKRPPAARWDERTRRCGSPRNLNLGAGHFVLYGARGSILTTSLLYQGTHASRIDVMDLLDSRRAKSPILPNVAEDQPSSITTGAGWNDVNQRVSRYPIVEPPSAMDSPGSMLCGPLHGLTPHYAYIFVVLISLVAL